MSYNQATILGNLTRDIESKTILANGEQMTVAEFGVAVQRRGKDKDAVDFIDVTAFGKLADVLVKHFSKGKPILVSGSLRQDTWEDKTSGQSRSKLKIVADTFSFAGDGGGGGGRSPAAGPINGHDRAPRTPVVQTVDDDDIPF
jgi:single-strand DNA-binding protein